MLIDAFSAIPAARRLGFRQWIARTAYDLDVPFTDRVANAPPYSVRIEHGRWLADCANCPGAENVTADDPVMFCFSCGNSHLAGKLAPLQFPDMNTRHAIERILDKRPRQNQNWTFAETVADLAADNIAHGLPPVDGKS